MVSRGRLRKHNKVTRPTRGMEDMKEAFMGTLRVLRGQADGQEPPPEHPHKHTIVENSGEPGGRIERDSVEDLSEP